MSEIEKEKQKEDVIKFLEQKGFSNIQFAQPRFPLGEEIQIGEWLVAYYANLSREIYTENAPVYSGIKFRANLENGDLKEGKIYWEGDKYDIFI